MKHSLKAGAGYMVVDHRDSPGLSAADVAHIPGAFAVGAGKLFEDEPVLCTHCQRGVFLRVDRDRTRGYCPKCDHYICDSCAALRVKTGDCVPFLQVLDRAMAIAEKFVGQPDHPDAVIDLDALRTVTPTVAVPAGPAIVLTDQ